MEDREGHRAGGDGGGPLEFTGGDENAIRGSNNRMGRYTGRSGGRKKTVKEGVRKKGIKKFKRKNSNETPGEAK